MNRLKVVKGNTLGEGLVGRITLICTAHHEIGKCNVHELVKILLAVGPQVIFEEIRPRDFESFYAHESKSNVEIRAIKEYLKGRKAQQVPVDDYEIPEGFGPSMRALDEFVESRSSAYCDAMDEMHQKQAALGFSYLNSSAFVSSIKQCERLYQEAVSTYGNDLARSKLSEWNDHIRKRDSSMLRSIYRFCLQTDFSEGVFLIGAGHMPSMKDGIERRTKDQPDLVSWRFWSGP